MSHAVQRSAATRVIHLLLLLAVLNQLVSSQFMERPEPGEAASWTFNLHQYVGLGSLLIVTMFWLWAVVRRGETRFGRLLPWFSAARCRAVFADAAVQLHRLLRMQPPDDGDGALASAVHGLGLLVVTAMAVTGTIYFFTWGTPMARNALSLHKLLANLTWAYLVAHAGLALLHHAFGSDIFSRMFLDRRKVPEAASSEW